MHTDAYLCLFKSVSTFDEVDISYNNTVAFVQSVGMSLQRMRFP